MIFVMLSWILTSYFGRRSIYLWGSFANFVLLIALGIAASTSPETAAAKHMASLAQASLGLIVSVLFTLGPAPASWVIIGETSAIRLRPLTTGVGRAAYYIVEFPCIFLASYMLNPNSGNRKFVLNTVFNSPNASLTNLQLVASAVTCGVRLLYAVSSPPTSSFPR